MSIKRTKKYNEEVILITQTALKKEKRLKYNDLKRFSKQIV